MALSPERKDQMLKRQQAGRVGEAQDRIVPVGLEAGGESAELARLETELLSLRNVEEKRKNEERLLDGVLTRPVLVESIIVTGNNPRKSNFSGSEFDEFVQSIKDHGLIEPIAVNQRPDGSLVLLAGERRLKAVQNLGLKHIPATIRHIESEIDEIIVTVHENEQRAPLTPEEEADYIDLLLERGKSQTDVAKIFGRDRSFISRTASGNEIARQLKARGLNIGAVSRALLAEIQGKTPQETEALVAQAAELLKSGGDLTRAIIRTWKKPPAAASNPATTTVATKPISSPVVNAGTSPSPKETADAADGGLSEDGQGGQSPMDDVEDSMDAEEEGLDGASQSTDPESLPPAQLPDPAAPGGDSGLTGHQFVITFALNHDHAISIVDTKTLDDLAGQINSVGSHFKKSLHEFVSQWKKSEE